MTTKKIKPPLPNPATIDIAEIAARNLAALMPIIAARVERDGLWVADAAAKLAAYSARCLARELMTGGGN